MFFHYKCNDVEWRFFMTNKKDDEKEKIQGRLTVVQSLWDYERTQILKALGIAGDINPRRSTTAR